MIRVLTVAAVLVALPSAAPAQRFEGEIKSRTVSVGSMALEYLELTAPDQVFALPIERFLALQSDPDVGSAVSVEETVIAVKGSLIRADLPLAEGADPADRWFWVINLDDGSSLMVQPGRRRYAAFTEEPDAPAASAPATPSGPRPRPRLLAGSRTVAGVRTTGYEVRTESEIARGWIAQQDDLQSVARGLERFFATMVGQMADDREIDADELLLAHGFPMLLQTLEIMDDQLGDYEIAETVSLDRKSLPASLFVVPAGYQKVTWEQLIQESIR